MIEGEGRGGAAADGRLKDDAGIAQVIVEVIVRLIQPSPEAYQYKFSGVFQLRSNLFLHLIASAF